MNNTTKKWWYRIVKEDEGFTVNKITEGMNVTLRKVKVFQHENEALEYVARKYLEITKKEYKNIMRGMMLGEYISLGGQSDEGKYRRLRGVIYE